MSKRFEVRNDTSGRVTISTFSNRRSWKVSLLLMLRYGFYRRGPYVPPLTGEAVHPRFHRGKLIIASGWDNWFGYDWSSTNGETDIFLLDFYERHCRDR